MATENGKNIENYQCPCVHWDQGRIFLAPRSEVDTENLIRWLSGGTKGAVVPAGSCRSKNKGDDGICNARGRCSNRVGAAFTILNGLRDGCRSYISTSSLESFVGQSKPSDGWDPRSDTPAVRTAYDTNFPVLRTNSSAGGVSSDTRVLARRKKPQQQSTRVSNKLELSAAGAVNCRNRKDDVKIRSKRRIRPAAANSFRESSASQLPAWSNKSHTGNISSLPSEDTDEMIRLLPPHKARQKALDSANEKIKIDQQKRKALKDQNSLTTKKTINLERSPEKNSDSPCVPARSKSEAKEHQCPPSSKRVCSGDVYQSSRPLEYEEVVLQEQLVRLVTIYSTTIDSSLVPSTPLELHLMIRLLSAASDGTIASATKVAGEGKSSKSKHTEDPITSFAYLFPVRQSCGSFASRVLRRMRLHLFSLGYDMIKDLSSCKLLESFIPDVVEELRLIIDRGDRQLTFETDLHDQVTIAGRSMASIYALPFDQNRDSRHNYRTVEQTRIFTNREECRDCFIYQLRTFQGIRGKLFDQREATRYKKDVRAAAKKLLQDLFPCNVFWFTQLFCDLLLQVGMLPCEETDNDVLKQVADVGRLKKLHERISTKGSQLNKSSQKLFLAEEEQSSNVLQPEHLFPGHQEFFFLFVMSADSYGFGVKLSLRLSGELSNLMNVNDTKGFVQRLFKMKLLGKFLGLMTFSLNWDVTAESLSPSDATLSLDAFDAVIDCDLYQPPFRVRDYIEKAWKNGCLINVIPWVIDFLSMIKWDLVSLKSSYYTGVLGLLRSIHLRLCSKEVDSRRKWNANLQLISLGLESFFGEIIGLNITQHLPLVKLVERNLDNDHPTEKNRDLDLSSNVSIDYFPVWFSKAFLFSMCPHLEELHKLLVDLNFIGKKTIASGASKKMRPYAIIPKPSSTNFPFMGSLHQSLSPLSSKVADESNLAIRAKLIDTFFHQHRNLQHVADVVVDLSVKNVCSMVLETFILPTLERTMWNNASRLRIIRPSSEFFELHAYLEILDEIEEESKRQAYGFMEETCERSLVHAMGALVPLGTPLVVREIAITLSKEHALQVGRRMIESFVKTESKKHLDSALSKEKIVSGAAKKSDKCTKGFESVHVWRYSCMNELEHIVVFLDEQVGVEVPGQRFVDGETLQPDFDRCVGILESLRTIEGEIKGSYPIIERFGRALVSLLALWFSEERRQHGPWSKKQESFVTIAMTIASTLAKKGCLEVPGLRAVGIVMRKNLLAYLFSNEDGLMDPALTATCICGDGMDKKIDVLLAMIDSSLVRPVDLESTLVQLLTFENVKIASFVQSLLKKMDHFRGFSSDDAKTFKMGKLRDILSVIQA